MPREKVRLSNEFAKMQNIFLEGITFHKEIDYFLEIEQRFYQNICEKDKKCGVYVKRCGMEYGSDIQAFFMLEDDGIIMSQFDQKNEVLDTFKISREELEQDFISLEDALDEYRENNKYTFYKEAKQYCVIVGPLTFLYSNPKFISRIPNDFNKDEIINEIKQQLLMYKCFYKKNSLRGRC